MPSTRKRGLSFRSYVSTGALLHRGHTLPPSNPLQPLICTVCHFCALDGSGLLQHLHDSAHCYRIVNADQGPPISRNDHDYPDDDNILPFAGDDSTTVLQEDPYESDSSHVTVNNPNEEPHACALSHQVLHWSSSSDEDDNDIDLHDEDQQEEEASVLANIYEFHEETDFPCSPDDAAHVFLADLCCRIRAPLYAYDEILKWGTGVISLGVSLPYQCPYIQASNLQFAELTSPYSSLP
jgi:hypothetical protein